MVTVRPVGEAAQKFARAAPAAAGDYATRAKAAAAEYASNASAAAGTYRAAVSQGDIEARFRSGVTKAGAAKFARGVEQKGQARYGPGVQAAQADYQAGVQPYFEALSAVNLPARGPKGSPQNLARVQPVVQAMLAAKARQIGTGR